MSARIISTTGRIRSLQLAECLSSLLALELVVPSPRYYLISPWLSDFVIMNNGFGQFRALLPDRLNRQVRMSMLLKALYERGAEIFVVTSSDSSEFLKLLPSGAHLQVRVSDEVHEKTFVCQSFLVDGSMNFTFRGANRSGEKVRIVVEPSEINKGLLDANARWESVS